jgi:hypothetical protein
MITRICAGLIGKLMRALVSVLCLSGFSLAASPDNTKLTGAYFRLLEAGAAQVEARLCRALSDSRNAGGASGLEPFSRLHSGVRRSLQQETLR